MLVDSGCQCMLYTVMPRFMIRIDVALYNDLLEIAAEGFEGNLSMVARKALRDFRDRHHHRQRTQSAEDREGTADRTS